MKKQILLGLLACVIISCDNQETSNSATLATSIVKYVYKGTEYVVEMRELSDGSFEEVSEMAPELEQALSLPAPYFVQDSLDADKFYIFDSVPHMVEVYDDTKLVAEKFKNRQLLKSAGGEPADEYEKAGYVYAYKDTYYGGPTCVQFRVRQANCNARMIINGEYTDYWGIRNLKDYGENDEISSILIFANRNGKQSGYYKVRFFEDTNYSGCCLEMRCTYMDYDGDYLYEGKYVCDSKETLKKVYMKKKLFKKIYWNDQISSLYYFYTTK